MTTDVIHFSITAAQAALARSDDGDTPLPGDAFLIDALEQYCRQGHDEFEYARREREVADYFAAECAACGPDGSTGPVCDGCFVDTDADAEVAAA